MTATEVAFKITTSHTAGEPWHEWYFPNVGSGEYATERRDRAGRLAGKRDAYFPEWLVLECNNRKCAGQAVVPVAFVTDFANKQDPEVTR